MNQKLYKKIIIAMMITAAGAVTAGAADITANTVEPVILPIDNPTSVKHAKHVKPVKVKDTDSMSAKTDVSPELRESIAQKVLTEKQTVQDKAKKSGHGQFIAVGQVSSNQTLELTLPKTVSMALNYNRDIKIAHYGLKETEYDIDEARAGLRPSVDYTWSGARAESNSTSTVMGKIDSIGNTFSNTLAISLPLYTDGLTVTSQVAAMDTGH